jgi:hypothetical protein
MNRRVERTDKPVFYDPRHSYRPPSALQVGFDR